MDYLGTYPAIHLMFAITQVVQKATSSWNILLFIDPGYDITYCYIIVPNKSQSLCCRRKKAFFFQALKLEIYLEYAFNLNLCYY